MTQEQLASELAEQNDRCGHIEADQICLRPRNHDGEHKSEPISRVIPIH